MTILTLSEAWKRGRIVAGGWQGDYPEDEWIEICDNWDVNLWSDENEKGELVNYASIYPFKINAETGCKETDYQEFYKVWERPASEF